MGKARQALTPGDRPGVRFCPCYRVVVPERCEVFVIVSHHPVNKKRGMKAEGRGRAVPTSAEKESTGEAGTQAPEEGRGRTEKSGRTWWPVALPSSRSRGRGRPKVTASCPASPRSRVPGGDPVVPLGARVTDSPFLRVPRYLYHQALKGGRWAASRRLPPGNLCSALARAVLLVAGIQGRGGEISEQMGRHESLQFEVDF